MGENSIVSILILLLLFIGLPALLKRLGQHTSAGKDAESPHEQEREAMHEDNLHEYRGGSPCRHRYDRATKQSLTNKPIHPGWF